MPPNWWCRRGIAFAFALGIGAPSIRAQTAEELYERAFGRAKPQATREIALPVIFEERQLGTVPATLPARSGDLRLRTEALASLLEGLVRPERLAALRSESTAGSESTELGRLRELGWVIEFDAAALVLHLEVDPRDRSLRELPMRAEGPPELGGVPLTPERRSAFANLRWAAARAANGGASSLAMEFAPTFDLGMGVLEGSLSGRVEAGATVYRRGDVRWVRDDPARQRRWLVGDVSYPVGPFQAFRPLAGIAVAREFSLDPYRVVQPLGEAEVLLTRPSRVEVRVNGRGERVLRLAPGRYRVRDFFLESGWNDVVLAITDDSGRVSEIDLSLAFHPELLKTGLTHFAVAAGVEAREGAEGAHYEADRPLASLLGRRGLRDTWTVGGGLQVDRAGFIASGESLVALPWGALWIEPAISGRESGPFGGALRLAFARDRVARQGGAGSRRWTLEGTWRDAGFRRFGDEDSKGPERRFELAMRLQQRIGASTTAGFSLNGARNSGSDQEVAAAVSLRRSLGARSFAAVDLGWRREFDGSQSRRIAVSWSVSLSGARDSARQRVHAAWDSVGDSGRIDWSYSPTEAIGTWNADASISSGRSGALAAVEARRSGDRGEVRAIVDWAEGGDSTAQVSWDGSLVLAGGRAALGRPIAGACALLAPHPSLAGLTIGADRSRDTFAVRAGRGRGVVPDLAPYLARSLAVEVADLPPGFDPGPGVFRLLPRYGSVTVVPVGTGATLALAGTLVDEAGAPVALASGRVEEASPAGKPPIFFTNRAGRFRVEGLHPGRLVLRLDDGRFAVVESGPDRSGVLDLGAVRVDPRAAP